MAVTSIAHRRVARERWWAGGCMAAFPDERQGIAHLAGGVGEVVQDN
jgi:hypothetical protein